MPAPQRNRILQRECASDAKRWQRVLDMIAAAGPDRDLDAPMLDAPSSTFDTLISIFRITSPADVDVDDLFALLAAWGACADCDSCHEDVDRDCTVDALDLLRMRAEWG